MSDDVEILIDRQHDFRAFWANAYAEFGYASTTMDLMFALEGQIQASAVFSTAAAGVQIETCMGALGVIVDAGQNFEFDATLCRFKTLDIEADCNRAQAELSKVQRSVVAMENRMTKLQGLLSSVESCDMSLTTALVLARM